MRKSTFLAAAIAATLSTSAFAQGAVDTNRATVGETYINIFGGNTFYDSNAGLGIHSQNNAGVGGFRIGTRATPHVGAELDFDYARADMQADPSNNMANQFTGSLVGVFYAFDKDSTPYMTLGLGASSNRYSRAPNVDRNTALMGVWGLGYKQRIGSSLDLRFDAQNQILFNPQVEPGRQLSNLRLTAGAGFAWGGSKPMKQVAATPAPAPAAEPVVPAPVPPVAAEPAPAPTPAPAPRTEVERTLLANKPVVINAAQFNFDSAKIKPSARETMGEVVEFTKKYPDAKLNIGGFTDNIGSYSYNMRLSIRRAQAVKNYLVKEGVPADRMSVRGYSYSRPIASNKTAAGRAKNRRAEIRTTVTVQETTKEVR